MAIFKLVIGDPKTKKSYQREVVEPNSKKLNGLKVGEIFKGELIDLPGYEFQITGGSDNCGFPMRKDVTGPVRRRITAVKGVGIKRPVKGMKQKKTVFGNTISDAIAQINVKVVKEGKEPLAQKAEDKKDEQSA